LIVWIFAAVENPKLAIANGFQTLEEILGLQIIWKLKVQALIQQIYDELFREIFCIRGRESGLIAFQGSECEY
jgi:hypothetical protein